MKFPAFEPIDLKNQYKKPKAQKTAQDGQADRHPLAQKLSDCLAAPVAIEVNEKGQGRVVIHFSSLAEVDALLERLEL